MARILCAYSGIEYKCEHMAVYLSSRESHHPIFDIPTSRLLQLTPRWLQGEQSHTENYLLYLALFNSTELMDFRVPAIMCADTPSIVAQNMDRLAAIVERIHTSGSTKVREILHLPSFVISPDTKDLTSSHDWITLWENSYKDYADRYRSSTAAERLEHKETILERWIKDNTKDVSQYAGRLADWAYDAGKFEQLAGYEVLNEHNKIEVMASYWRRIIIACAKDEAIWSINKDDLQDLIEHCEEHIYHGSIYSHTLMSLLRAGAERKRNFLDLGDIDVGSNGISFRILDADASVEDANKLALIDSAPVNKPVESNYPNKLAYIKAKLNWQMAQDYKETQAMAAKLVEINAATSPITTVRAVSPVPARKLALPANLLLRLGHSGNTGNEGGKK